MEIDGAIPMYVDNESIKVFERMHERDRLVQQLHHIDEDSPDLDIFSAHMAENRGQDVLVIAVVFAVILSVLAYFLVL